MKKNAFSTDDNTLVWTGLSQLLIIFIPKGDYHLNFSLPPKESIAYRKTLTSTKNKLLTVSIRKLAAIKLN